jgi:hypothetical protein
MRFRLRTLMILLAVLPPLSAGAWMGGNAAVAELQRYRTRVQCAPNQLKPWGNHDEVMHFENWPTAKPSPNRN